MGYIGKEQPIKVGVYYEQHGEKATLKHFNYKLASLKRYLREYEKLKDPSYKAEKTKILLFDLENSPCEAYVWNTKDQYVGPEQIKKPWAILTWSAKWLCDNEMMSMQVSAREAHLRKDKSIIKRLWELFDEADVIMAHNLVKFDRKRSNTRFLLNGLEPPSPYRMIDTLTQYRKEFDFLSNKLDYLGETLTGRGKLPTGFNLWKRCVDGTKEDAQKALTTMREYNENDVVLMEDVYLIGRPWFKTHPNLGAYYEGGGTRCSHCESTNLTFKKKYYTTNTGQYRTARCDDCGAWMRVRNCKDRKKNLLVPSAR